MFSSLYLIDSSTGFGLHKLLLVIIRFIELFLLKNRLYISDLKLTGLGLQIPTLFSICHASTII